MSAFTAEGPCPCHAIPYHAKYSSLQIKTGEGFLPTTRMVGQNQVAPRTPRIIGHFIYTRRCRAAEPYLLVVRCPITEQPHHNLLETQGVLNNNDAISSPFFPHIKHTCYNHIAKILSFTTDHPLRFVQG